MLLLYPSQVNSTCLQIAVILLPEIQPAVFYVDSITNCIFMLPVTNGSSYFSRITNGSSYVASITNCSSYVATNVCKDPSNLCTMFTNVSEINFIVKKSFKLVKPMQRLKVLSL